MRKLLGSWDSDFCRLEICHLARGLSPTSSRHCRIITHHLGSVDVLPVAPVALQHTGKISPPLEPIGEAIKEPERAASLKSWLLCFQTSPTKPVLPERYVAQGNQKAYEDV